MKNQNLVIIMCFALIVFLQTSFSDIFPPIPLVTISGAVIENTSPLDLLKPISSAKVYLKTYFNYLKDSSEIMLPLPYPDTILDSTITDPKGLYLFKGVEPERSYLVTVMASGYAEQTKSIFADGKAPNILNFQLVPEGKYAVVSGYVYDGSAGLRCRCLVPLESVMVSVEYPVYMVKRGGAPFYYGQYQAITDTNGYYIIDSVIIGGSQYAMLVAYKDGYVMETISNPILLVNDTTRYNFTLYNEKNSATNTTDKIVFTLTSDKPSYERDETIYVEFSITNADITTRTFNFSSGCQLQCRVNNNVGDTLYNSLRNTICIAMPTEVTIAPGSTEIIKTYISTNEFVGGNIGDGRLELTAQLIGYDQTQILIYIDYSGAAAIFIDRSAGEGNALDIYPNPFANSVNIALNRYGFHDKQANLGIYNAHGRLIKNFVMCRSGGLSGSLMQWDGKDNYGQPVPAGAYVLRVQAADALFIQKIFKNK